MALLMERYKLHFWILLRVLLDLRPIKMFGPHLLLLFLWCDAMRTEIGSILTLWVFYCISCGFELFSCFFFYAMTSFNQIAKDAETILKKIIIWIFIMCLYMNESNITLPKSYGINRFVVIILQIPLHNKMQRFFLCVCVCACVVAVKDYFSNWMVFRIAYQSLGMKITHIENVRNQKSFRFP